MFSKLAVYVTLASVIFAGVFGFFAMPSDMHDSVPLCPFSGMSGADCISIHNNFEVAFHHISGMFNLFETTALRISHFLFALSLFILLVAFCSVVAINYCSNYFLRKYRLSNSKEIFYAYFKPLIRWLAVKKSESDFLYRVFALI